VKINRLIMELDNVIYIVLIIAIFIVSLLGRSTKKKTNVPVAETDEVAYSLNDFEKILERKQEYIKIEEEKPEVEETISQDQIEPAIHNKSDKIKSSKNSVKKDENEINDGFDIKSAIIYSTILERKKFRR
jgi:hypothetical protein